ncbi:hypothetical protein HanLR1_Chr03g0079371 [Helianthus annuus]|nr:hypothetical protein HanHA89_Chr03g0085831 [Helianthus annuus]KAJ0766598.1 hypothetical protein HanLR1_Chr03g0079371 [Helianthus annuus]
MIIMVAIRDPKRKSITDSPNLLKFLKADESWRCFKKPEFGEDREEPEP